MTEFQILSVFIISGIMLGILYEPLRAVRYLIPHNKIALNTEDFIYLGLWGVILFAVSLKITGGLFSIAYLPFTALGAIAYMLTVGRLTGVIMKYITKVVKHIIFLILKPFKNLFVFIAQKVKIPFVALYKKLENYARKPLNNVRDARVIGYKTIRRNERGEEDGFRSKIKVKIR